MFCLQDDTSWKVRRAAAKVLAATVTSRPQELHATFDLIAKPLVRRFKEREETVRMEVRFQCRFDVTPPTGHATQPIGLHACRS